MRDVFFILIVPFLIFFTLRRPFIGLGLWIWSALFLPNAWVYGMAGSIRYNLLFAGLTIITYFFSSRKSEFQFGMVGILVALFFAWATISTAFGLAPSEIAWQHWERLAKGMALFLFIILVVDKKLHVDFFFWCLVFSIGFYAALEGLKYIVSGGGHKLEGLYGHVLGDRNDLALGLAMFLPICFYLLAEFGKKSWVIKFALLGLIVLVVTSVIGTGSRGGLVALSAVGAYLFIKSKRKILFALLVIVALSAVVEIIPEQWFLRMETIGDANLDASFMGRVVAWKLSFILASQNPFFGGGFKALEYFPVWSSLSQDFYKYTFFYTGAALPDVNVAHAAHSIYFQVLGDLGFVGFFLFLSILCLSFFKAGAIAKKAKDVNGAEWIVGLANMLRLSIFAYAVGGAALSFAYFELFYAFCAMIIVLESKILPKLIR